MCYELTDDDINRLWRRMFGWAIAVEPNDRIDRAAVRRWFAALPVVALADVERAMGPATVNEAKAAWDACMASGGTVVDGVSAAVDSVLSRRRSMLGMPDPEPPPPAADYMAYHPDRIEFRAKGSGQDDPVVATITAGGLLRAMRAAVQAELRAAIQAAEAATGKEGNA